MDAGDGLLSTIGIAVDRLCQRRHVRNDAVHRRLFAFRPLQQPTWGPHVGEAHEPVVEHALRPDGRERGGDIDDMYVGIGLNQIREHDVADAEAHTVSIEAPLGEAERLHCRLGQIVDQDRRRRALAQLLQDVAGFRDIGGVRAILTGLGIESERVTRSQCVDQNHIVLVLAHEANIVGKRRGNAKVDPALRPLTPQEVGFHLQIAVPEQNDINALLLAIEV
jgi:hypothetical protein